MIKEYGMTRSNVADQLFYKKGDDGNINIFVAKVVDDLLIAATQTAQDHFLRELNRQFTLGRTTKKDTLNFLGCSIICDKPGDLIFQMPDYLERLQPLNISRARKMSPRESANEAEEKEYRCVAGSLLYFGQAVMPQGCLAASRMQQRIGSLCVADIISANEMIIEIKRLIPLISFPKIKNITCIDIVTMSDWSHYSGNETLDNLV